MRTTILVILLAAFTGHAQAVTVFSEGTLGDFSNDFTSATDLGTLHPYMSTTVSGFGDDGDLDYFDFTLSRPANVDALIDLSGTGDASAVLGISTGLDSDNRSIFIGDVGGGSTALGTLGPGSYTVLNTNGSQYAWDLNIAPVPAPATPVYQFHQAGTGDILATLTLSTLPAGDTEVVSLTFTPEGDALLGLGPTYTGVFDNDWGLFADDGVGGLQGTRESDTGIFVGEIFSDDSPDSTVFGTTPLIFAMGAINDPNQDVMYLIPPGPTVLPVIDIRGDWRLVETPAVPEPVTASLISLAAAPLLMRRRRASR